MDVRIRSTYAISEKTDVFILEQSLEVSFRVKHSDGHHVVYANSGSMKCFECSDMGHKYLACSHRQRTEGSAGAGNLVGSGSSRGKGKQAEKVPSQPEESHTPPVVKGKSTSLSSASETKARG